MEVCLENLGNGAAKELFDHALKQVVANIDDPNTDWKPTRSITMVVKFFPDEERGQGKMTVSVKPALAPIKSFSNTVLLGKIDGKASMVEVDRLFKDPKPEGQVGGKKVYSLKHEGGAES